MTNDSETAVRRKWWVRPALLIVSSLVGVLLAEGATRVWLSAKGEPYDTAAQIEKLSKGIDTTEAFTPQDEPRADGKNAGGVPFGRILHPYYGAEDRPDTGNILQYFAGSPPEENFEVLIVGGSVAMLFARDAGADLQKRLEADERLKGRSIRLLRGAHAAYKQPQQLNKVAYLLSHGYRPDVVINLDGFNEFALGLQNTMTGTHPLYPSPPVWGGVLLGKGGTDPALALLKLKHSMSKAHSRQVLNKAVEQGILKSAMGGLFIQKQLDSQRAERTALQEKLLRGDTGEIAKLTGEAEKQAVTQQAEMRGQELKLNRKETVDLLLSNWLESSISLQAICQARGVAYIHALQPTLNDKGSKPKVGKELNITAADGWVRGVELGYPAIRSAIPKLEAAGVQFLDLSMVFKDIHEPLYYDACHYSKPGAQLLVGPIAKAILSTLD